jgi:hypothetical protein
MHVRPFVNSLGALTGNQAMHEARAGVPAVYLSGWQVAADANDSLAMYPDQSLYATTRERALASGAPTKAEMGRRIWNCRRAPNDQPCRDTDT